MSFIRQIEEAAARRLKKIFLSSEKYAESAIADLEKMEKAVIVARDKVVEATELAHVAAVEAAQKAKEVAAQLDIEVKIAEERMQRYKEMFK